MRALAIAIAVLAAACSDIDPEADPPIGCNACEDVDAPAAPVVCHFPSGRPCTEGDICLNTPGDECGYVYCDAASGQLLGSLPSCQRGSVDPVPGGPFDCDPTSLRLDGYLPPPAPCPIGALWSIEGGLYGQCVPVSQCRPLPCNPAYNGDGCPSDYACDAASSTCVPAG